MNIWLTLAGLAAVATCLVHVFAGGREAARPLLDAPGIDPLVKYTNYYCWHLVTIAIALMAGMLLMAGLGSGSRDLAVAAIATAGLFSAWSMVLVIWARQSFVRMPQWAIFLAIASLGGLGLR